MAWRCAVRASSDGFAAPLRVEDPLAAQAANGWTPKTSLGLVSGCWCWPPNHGLGFCRRWTGTTAPCGFLWSVVPSRKAPAHLGTGAKSLQPGRQQNVLEFAVLLNPSRCHHVMPFAVGVVLLAAIAGNYKCFQYRMQKSWVRREAKFPGGAWWWARFQVQRPSPMKYENKFNWRSRAAEQREVYTAKSVGCLSDINATGSLYGKQGDLRGHYATPARTRHALDAINWHNCQRTFALLKTHKIPNIPVSTSGSC